MIAVVHIHFFRSLARLLASVLVHSKLEFGADARHHYVQHCNQIVCAAVFMPTIFVYDFRHLCGFRLSGILLLVHVLRLTFFISFGCCLACVS